jgi:TetR/AcrR family transcriptional regulator, regulator of cefoperazone and chloramphenicol sensitivity
MAAKRDTTHDSDPALAAHADTRQRLLEAAGEVFAEQGFRNATVRDICSRAGANIAAVNYYFQGKDGLYGQVVQYAQCCAREQHPILSDPNITPQQRLGEFVRSFLERLLDEGRPAWHGKLMAREMVEPSAALDRIVTDTVRPTFNTLSGIVSDLLGPGADESLIRRSAASVIGQCLMYHHCRPVMDRLFTPQRFTPEAVAELAAHITRFSLAGLESVRPRARAGPPPHEAAGSPCTLSPSSCSSATRPSTSASSWASRWRRL